MLPEAGSPFLSSVIGQGFTEKANLDQISIQNNQLTVSGWLASY